MRRVLMRFVSASGTFVLMLALSLPVAAQPSASKSAVLWYRGSEGCPDGAGFLARVGDRASLVRLADVGDRVDFVVNISVMPGGARGRLERETERGTVAIREFEDASCTSVADVLALNLALALDPEQQTAEPAEPLAVDGGADLEAANEGETAGLAQGTRRQRSQHREVPPLVQKQPTSPRGLSPNEQEGQVSAGIQPTRWRVGLQGGVLGGVSPELLARGAAFLELGGALDSWLPDLLLRAAAVGAIGSRDTSEGAVRQSLWAGRLDICPVSVGGPILSLRPCGAGELGQMRASRAHRDSSLWAALGVHFRGSWSLEESLSVEAELGAMFPLRRYEVSAGSSVLYQSAPAGLSGVVGISIGF
jgi:hypothetical protein